MAEQLYIVRRVTDGSAADVRTPGDGQLHLLWSKDPRNASELIRPVAVTFLDQMLRDRDRNLRVEEVRIGAGSPAIGRKVGDLGINAMPGVLSSPSRNGWPRKARTVQVFPAPPRPTRINFTSFNGRVALVCRPK